jgi:peroxiredoxin
MRMMTVCLCAIAFAWSTTISAGEYNVALNIGDAAPAWKELPGVDGKKHSLADLKDKPVVVVVFTCNSCPVATDYEDRIIAMAKKYGGADGHVAVVAINVNRIEADSLPKMKERAEAKGFPFPYLYDASQKIGKAYGATFTPEFFVLDKNRKVVYMGGMDDSSNAANVKNRYLEPAIEAALKGEKPAKTETVAIGCRVRYARERRQK